MALCDLAPLAKALCSQVQAVCPGLRETQEPNTVESLFLLFGVDFSGKFAWQGAG